MLMVEYLQSRLFLTLSTYLGDLLIFELISFFSYICNNTLEVYHSVVSRLLCKDRDFSIKCKVFSVFLLTFFITLMESTVKQRLIDFIKFKNLSQAKFEKAIGVSNGFVNNISKGIGADKLQRILNAYPELNSTWLLTGNGEMLKQDNSSKSSENTTLLQRLVDSLQTTIETQKALIDAKNAEIERLQRALLEKEVVTSKVKDGSSLLAL
jgi:transcriptional regulator with XRE-family HTH domain